MPQIKISCVVSFSSEEKNYPASNLLSNDVVHNRWVGQKGEASNSVVLQLEKSTQITSVSIGTYHSALIEVLVGRSEASSQPYEVLICASSFMNPADSRNSENISRVRTFSKEQMVPDTQSKKWDRVRVVCTQPYNKHVQYGLSFIQFFISDTPNAPVSSSPQTPQNSQTTMLGRFKLRAASSDEDEDKPGELFARFKQKGPLSTDAQIRQAGSPISLNSNKTESNLLVKTARPQKVNKPNDFKASDNEDTLSRRRDELFYDEKDDGSDKIDRIMKRDRETKAKLNDSEKINEEKKTKTSRADDSERMTNKDVKTTSKKNSLFDSGEAKKKDGKVTKDKPNASVSKDTPRSTKTTSDKDKTDSSKKKGDRKRQHSSDRGEASTSKKQRSKDDDDDTDFPDLDITRGPKCLSGVVFVLSGYVNPKRSTLRDTAISLGARYSPDWGPNCTHLVCAFPNTPKHDQVKRLGVQASIVSGQWIEECSAEQAHLPWRWYAMDAQHKISRPRGPLPKTKDKQAECRDKKDGSNLSPPISNPAPRKGAISDSENDTDDEIEKVMQQQKIRDSNIVKEKVQSEVESSKKMPPVKKHEALYDSDSITDIDEDILNKLTNQTQILKEPEKEDDLKLYISDDSVDDDDKEIKKLSQSTPVKKILSKDSSFSDNSNDVSIKTLPDVAVCKENVIDLDNLAFDEVLPDIFSGIKFYIDPNLSTVKYDVDEVKRYVLAYNGEVLERWPNKAVDVAITTKKLAEDLREEKAKKCQFMPPEWVWKCNDTRELFPFERFRIF